MQKTYKWRKHRDSPNISNQKSALATMLSYNIWTNFILWMISLLVRDYPIESSQIDDNYIRQLRNEVA